MHLDQVDVVGSGEVEAIENDVLVQVDHPHSGLGDVLLQDCFCKTRLHLRFNKIIIFQIYYTRHLLQISQTVLLVAFGVGQLRVVHIWTLRRRRHHGHRQRLVQQVSANIWFSVSWFFYDLCWTYIIKCLKRLLVRVRRDSSVLEAKSGTAVDEASFQPHHRYQ